MVFLFIFLLDPDVKYLRWAGRKDVLGRREGCLLVMLFSERKCPTGLLDELCYYCSFLPCFQYVQYPSPAGRCHMHWAKGGLSKCLKFLRSLELLELFFASIKIMPANISCEPAAFSPRKYRILANSLLHIHQGHHPQRNRVSPSSRKKSIFLSFVLICVGSICLESFLFFWQISSPAAGLLNECKGRNAVLCQQRTTFSLWNAETWASVKPLNWLLLQEKCRLEETSGGNLV